MKYCSKCILSENIFSVTINNNGLCNYCLSQQSAPTAQKNIADSFSSINLKQHIKNIGYNSDYDIALAYSGGKDSTYTLYLLKEIYNLNVLAITFDNGFLANETFKNIKRVCLSLDVDSLIIAPPVKKLNAIFRYSEQDESLPKKALERASAICTYCISLIKMNVYREAIMRAIPLIAFGWTPGQINIDKQIVTLDYKMLKSNFARIKNNISEEFGENYNSLLLADEVLDKARDRIPSLFYPFINNNYSEQQIIAKIKSLGWTKPSATDSNSTNCMLNAYAIYNHKEKYGFHPYAAELSHLVRNNLMTREEAFNRITQDADMQAIKYIKNKLRG